MVSYEAIRQWCRKFGQDYANQFKRRQPRPGDKWPVDEVFLARHGERHDLWRAVDQDDNVLDIRCASSPQCALYCPVMVSILTT